MQRRHFLKLSAVTTAAVIFSRVAHAAGEAMLINLPDEVWAQFGADWVRLKQVNHSAFSFKDTEVTLKTNGDALGVYVQSPATAITGIRLSWKYQVNAAAKSLGDHWERNYGDAAWVTPNAGIKNPWYVLLHDDHDTACFGVKTGCNAICYWNVKPGNIELTLDTHSGGVGVEPGQRKLHAADIITTKSTAQENPFATAQRFCKLMCPKPRLPKQPVYGINDWYYAYGNNSAKADKGSNGIDGRNW